MSALNFTPETSLNLIIVMGVSGTGKSTIAQELAKRLGYSYVEADDFHTINAKYQMAKNIPLTDAIREPWLARVAKELTAHYFMKKHVVLAYSGLKALHRDKFRKLNFKTNFILLDADEKEITTRLGKRKGHFASVELLQSQLDSMEAPLIKEHDIHVVNANRSQLEIMKKVHPLILGLATK